jgi:hypothetical protein
MTLAALKTALFAELPSDTAFRFINTRIILRTGVDLQREDNQVSDERLSMVRRELQEMGFLRSYDG